MTWTFGLCNFIVTSTPLWSAMAGTTVAAAAPCNDDNARSSRFGLRVGSWTSCFNACSLHMICSRSHSSVLYGECLSHLLCQTFKSLTTRQPAKPAESCYNSMLKLSIWLWGLPGGRYQAASNSPPISVCTMFCNFSMFFDESPDHCQCGYSFLNSFGQVALLGRGLAL